MTGILRKLKAAFQLLIQMLRAPQKERHELVLQNIVAPIAPIRTFVIQSETKRRAKRAELALPDREQPKQALSDLMARGYHRFPELIGMDVIDSILKQLNGLPCQDSYRAPNKWFLLNEAPPNTQLASYKVSDLVRIPELVRLANDPRLLWLAQEYLGCAPTISWMKVWWSFAGREQAEFSQMFHRDYDDLKFLKMFVYLTDVTAEDGPHAYVSGSAGERRFRRPSRYTDEFVQRIFPGRLVEMTGPKGTMFLEDTFGLHKGTMPRLNHRLVFNVIYTVRPVPERDQIPQRATEERGGGYDRYANRLLMSYDDGEPVGAAKR